MNCRCDSVVKLKEKVSELQACLSDPDVFKSLHRFAFDFAKVQNMAPTECVTLCCYAVSLGHRGEGLNEILTEIIDFEHLMQPILHMYMMVL